VSEDSHDEGAPTEPDNWKGDKRYFQTGKKAGQLKPSATSEEKQDVLPSLDFGDLRATGKQPEQPAPPDAKAEKAKAKAEKKEGEARIAAKIVMRTLDALVMWISGGMFGADFTKEQRDNRNKYAEEVEANWQIYLATLDIPMHPALLCFSLSALYVLPALDTPRGIERTDSLKEKVFGKIGMALFRSKKSK